MDKAVKSNTPVSMTKKQKDSVCMTGITRSSNLRSGTYTMVTGNYWKHGANLAQYTRFILKKKILDLKDQIIAQRWEMGKPMYS